MAGKPAALEGFTAEQDAAWGEALARNLHALWHTRRPLADAIAAAAEDCATRARVELGALDGRARRKTLRAARALTLQVWGAQHCGDRFGGCGEPPR